MNKRFPENFNLAENIVKGTLVGLWDEKPNIKLCMIPHGEMGIYRGLYLASSAPLQVPIFSYVFQHWLLSSVSYAIILLEHPSGGFQ